MLRYRAMIQGVSAPGLSVRPYFYRYSEDAIDLCEQLGVSVSSVVRFRSDNQISRAECFAYTANSGYGQPKRQTL